MSAVTPRSRNDDDGCAGTRGRRALRRRRRGHVPARRRVAVGHLRRALAAQVRRRRPSGWSRSASSVGDRVAVLCNTRVEFTVADLADQHRRGDRRARLSVELGRRVRVGGRRLRSRVDRLRGRRQVAKIDEVRASLPDLEHVVVIDGDGRRDADARRARRTRRGRRPRPSSTARIAAGRPRRRLPHHLHVGHDRAAQGRACSPTGLRRRPRVGPARWSCSAPATRCTSTCRWRTSSGSSCQADALEVGGARRVLGRRPQPDRRRAGPGATDRPAVGAAHLREGLRRWRWRSSRPSAGRRGGRGRRARRAGPRRRRSPARRSREAERAAFERADAEMFSLVRGIFGGNIKLAISGAAPIAPEILRFFYAAGVPVMEGWGMTETTAIGTLNLPDAHRFGTIGRPVAGADIRIADDGEIEMAGEMLHEGVLAQPRGHRRGDDRRRLPAHRRPGLDRRRRLRLRSPGARRTSSSRPAARTSRRPTSRATCGGRGGSPRW